MSNNLISRQDAINALKMDISIIPFAKAREYVRAAIDTIYNRLEELPSARRKGKWIYPTDIKGFGRCPNCKALWDYSLISNPFFKFCPRCGNGENELTELKGEEDVRESD